MPRRTGAQRTALGAASVLALSGGAAGWSAAQPRLRARHPPCNGHAAHVTMTQLEPSTSTASRGAQFVWGQSSDVAVGSDPTLMDLSASYGWCLLDSELKEMQTYQVPPRPHPTNAVLVAAGPPSTLPSS